MHKHIITKMYSYKDNKQLLIIYLSARNIHEKTEQVIYSIYLGYWIQPKYMMDFYKIDDKDLMNKKISIS